MTGIGQISDIQYTHVICLYMPDVYDRDTCRVVGVQLVDSR